MRRLLSAFSALGRMAPAPHAFGDRGDDGARVLRVDHYVRIKATAPAIAGQDAVLYVREIALENTLLRGGPAPDRVVLFVHGAGTPARFAGRLSARASPRAAARAS